MNEIRAKHAYIIAIEKTSIVGGYRQYHLDQNYYPIIGIEYRDCIVDIKTKKTYPILDCNSDLSIDSNIPFACIDELFLRRMGITAPLQIGEEDQELLTDQILETVEYLQHRENEEPTEKVVPYQKFLVKRQQYQPREKK